MIYDSQKATKLLRNNFVAFNAKEVLYAQSYCRQRQEKGTSQFYYPHKIMKILSEGAQEISPPGVRYLFRAAFRSAELKVISTALESAKKYLDLDEFFYLPYETALEYIKSTGDPAIMDRQPPEMRDAVQLLVNLYQEGI